MKNLMTRRASRILITCLAFSLILLGVTAATAWRVYAHYNDAIPRLTGSAPVLQTNSPDIREAPAQLHAENYLLIGSDSRSGLETAGAIPGQRSDTTIIIHLNKAHTKAMAINIPRDSWVRIPECRDSKGNVHPTHMGIFNSAFAEALPDGSSASSGAGAACVIRTLQKLTGIAIKHYVQINFAGFQHVVDALGGVTICSPQSLIHPEHDKSLVLKKGINKLDGSQAIAYVRLRHIGTGSDLERIKRQQRFLGAVLREARTGSMYTNPQKLNAFVSAAFKAILVDKGTSLTDLSKLFNSLKSLDPKHVVFYTPAITNPAYDPANPSSTHGNRVLLNSKANRTLYDEIINDGTIAVTSSKEAKIVAKPSGKPVTAADKSCTLTN